MFKKAYKKAKQKKYMNEINVLKNMCSDIMYIQQ